MKTIQLKKELDNLINAKELSGEDSSDGHNGMSPMTKEKYKYEQKLKKRLQKVMGTLVERVEHSSSNSSSGSEEKYRLYNKKRKYNDYLEGLHNYIEGSDDHTLRIPITHTKRLHKNE